MLDQNFLNSESFFYQNYSYFNSLIKNQLEQNKEIINNLIKHSLDKHIQELFKNNVNELINEINKSEIKSIIEREKNESIKIIKKTIEENKKTLSTIFKKTEEDFLKIKRSLDKKSTVNNLIDQYSSFFSKDSDYVELEKIGSNYKKIKEEVIFLKKQNMEKNNKINELVNEKNILKEEINKLTIRLNKIEINNKFKLECKEYNINYITKNINDYVDDLRKKIKSKYVPVKEYKEFETEVANKISYINDLIFRINMKNGKRQMDINYLNTFTKNINSQTKLLEESMDNLQHNLTLEHNNLVTNIFKNIDKIRKNYQSYTRDSIELSEMNKFNIYECKEKNSQIEFEIKKMKRKKEYDKFKTTHWEDN